MISLKINDEFRTNGDWDAQWINQAINRRRDAGEAVCVQVKIDEPPLDMVLSTPTCARGGGGRPPNNEERRIFDLWEKLHLNSVSFSSGNVVAFMNQLKHVTN